MAPRSTVTVTNNRGLNGFETERKPNPLKPDKEPHEAKDWLSELLLGTVTETESRMHRGKKVETSVLSLIADRLNSLTKSENITILYACESGSRAWGFPSPDSDYDIRIIYAHPIAWYLSVEEGRDVVDQPIERHVLGEIDLGGWDIRKTLRLAKKSNPAIWEWLRSPMVYHRQFPDAVQTLRDGIESCFSPISACHHYLSICRGTMARELTGDTVKIKKYFYMLRPILAASWIAQYKEVPPMEFQALSQMLDDAAGIRTKVDELLERKRCTDERVPISREPQIDAYLESELRRLTEVASRLPAAHVDADAIDLLFRKSLGIPPEKVDDGTHDRRPQTT